LCDLFVVRYYALCSFFCLEDMTILAIRVFQLFSFCQLTKFSLEWPISKRDFFWFGDIFRVLHCGFDFLVKEDLVKCEYCVHHYICHCYQSYFKK
jgi:hypothetical protein